MFNHVDDILGWRCKVVSACSTLLQWSRWFDGPPCPSLEGSLSELVWTIKQLTSAGSSLHVRNIPKCCSRTSMISMTTCQWGVPSHAKIPRLSQCSRQWAMYIWLQSEIVCLGAGARKIKMKSFPSYSKYLSYDIVHCWQGDSETNQLPNQPTLRGRIANPCISCWRSAGFKK